MPCSWDRQGDRPRGSLGLEQDLSLLERQAGLLAHRSPLFLPFPNPQGFKQLSRGSQQHSRWPARLAAPRDSGHWDGLSLLCGTLGGPTYHAGTIQDGGGAPVLTAGLQMDSSHIAEQEPATRAQMAPPEVCRALAGLARPRWR